MGKEVFDTIVYGLEGIIAKHKSVDMYKGYGLREWLKIKTIKTQDCVIIGYTRGRRKQRKLLWFSTSRS